LTDERLCLKSSAFPFIGAIALLVECQQDNSAVFIFPFTSEDVAVTGLRPHRRGKGIKGNSPLNRRLGASRCDQCAGEKERETDVS
jgi:hypothetical protein